MEFLTTSSKQINNFEDILGIGFELTHYYDFGHFTLLIDKEDRVSSIALFDRYEDTIFDAVCSIKTIVQNQKRKRIQYALHLSVVKKNIDQLCYVDLEIFQWAQRQVLQLGFPLKDWIEINQELYRSYAHTCTPNYAWTTKTIGTQIQAQKEVGRLSGVD